MRKVFSLSLIVLVAAVIAACADGTSSNPVAPVDQSSSLTAVSAESRSNDAELICHQNRDEDDGDWEWVAIEVNNTAMRQHCRDKDNRDHNDYRDSASPYGSCGICDLSSYSVGDDCSDCTSYPQL